ncbi:unnamed protein product, partial [Rotaria sp. Silwood1]
VQQEEAPHRSLQSYGIDYYHSYSLEYPNFTKMPRLHRYMNRVKIFHQALRIKYLYRCVFHCFFLFLFSYVLLFNFQRPTNENPSIHWTEVLTIIFVTCMLFEEIHYLKDLLFFMCIIFIVMSGYGVASRSLVYYPNADKFNQSNIDTSFDGRSVFRQITYRVYYLMYGEFGTELSNLDTYPNAAWSISTHVLLAGHMLFVNILLTNLLIAMFSKRFNQVYEDIQNIWHSQQYLFTRQYFTRSPYFPPISLIYDIYHLCRIAIFAVRRAKVFKIIPINKDLIKDWYEFEGASTYEYAHAQVKASEAASMISSQGSDLYNIRKRKETDDNKNDSKNSICSLQKIQDDLTNLKESFEESRRQINDALTQIKQSLAEFKQHSTTKVK